jgi:hypothetical protein
VGKKVPGWAAGLPEKGTRPFAYSRKIGVRLATYRGLFSKTSFPTIEVFHEARQPLGRSYGPENPKPHPKLGFDSLKTT